MANRRSHSSINGSKDGSGECDSLPQASQVAGRYWESLFRGDLCCKLWFTVPRSTSRKLVSRLTDLLRSAVVDQREDVNAHIPHEVLRGLAGHTRKKVCVANHKTFWPHPPTLLHLFGDMKVYGGAQCMGDMVVQNSSQLHWGVNLAPGVKAESTNCAGSDFMAFCPECSDGLYCGNDGELLESIFRQARKEYWVQRKVKTWKKKSICWGYHGCGCIRPRALGFSEKVSDECLNISSSQQGSKAVSSNVSAKLNGLGTRNPAPFDDARISGLGWGRAFDWKEVFAKYNVNLCFDKWNDLEWLPHNDACRPVSLQNLLEDETVAYGGAQSSATDKYNGVAGGRPRKQWEQDPDASCIRIVRSVSPERLKQSKACVDVDISRPSLNQKAGDIDSRKDGRNSEVPNSSPSVGIVSSIAASADDSEEDSCDDYVATVEFQRMWPVFLRVNSKNGMPASPSDDGSGEVLFLGCLLEVFHMRMKTQNDVHACLDAIVGVTKTEFSHETPGASPIHASCCKQNKASSGSDARHQFVEVSAHSQYDAEGRSRITAEERAPLVDIPVGHRPVSSSRKPLPKILFEGAPRTIIQEESGGILKSCESKPKDFISLRSSTCKLCGYPNQSEWEHKAEDGMASNLRRDLGLPPSTPEVSLHSQETSCRPCRASRELRPCPSHIVDCNCENSRERPKLESKLVLESSTVAPPPERKRGDLQKMGGHDASTFKKFSNHDDSDREQGQLSSGGLQNRLREPQQYDSHFEPRRISSTNSKKTPKQADTESASSLSRLTCGQNTDHSCKQMCPSLSGTRSRSHMEDDDQEIQTSTVQFKRLKGQPTWGIFPQQDRQSASSTQFANGVDRVSMKHHPHFSQEGAPVSTVSSTKDLQDPYLGRGASPPGSPSLFWRGMFGPSKESSAHSEPSRANRFGHESSECCRDEVQHEGNKKCVRNCQPRFAKFRDQPEAEGKRAVQIHRTKCSCVSGLTVDPGVDRCARELNDDAPTHKTDKDSACQPVKNSSINYHSQYSHNLRRRLEAVINGVWCWRSDSVSDLSAMHHDQPFSTDAARAAMKNGYVPYIMMHYASTTCCEKALQPLDMSFSGRKNIPFHGFPENLLESLCSGIGHGMMYYSALPGSVFPIHCEQGGLGAFNMIVGALATYTKQLLSCEEEPQESRHAATATAISSRALP